MFVCFVDSKLKHLNLKLDTGTQGIEIQASHLSFKGLPTYIWPVLWYENGGKCKLKIICYRHKCMNDCY